MGNEANWSVAGRRYSLEKSEFSTFPTQKPVYFSSATQLYSEDTFALLWRSYRVDNLCKAVIFTSQVGRQDSGRLAADVGSGTHAFTRKFKHYSIFIPVDFSWTVKILLAFGFYTATRREVEVTFQVFSSHFITCIFIIRSCQRHCALGDSTDELKLSFENKISSYVDDISLGKPFHNKSELVILLSNH